MRFSRGEGPSSTLKVRPKVDLNSLSLKEGRSEVGLVVTIMNSTTLLFACIALFAPNLLMADELKPVQLFNGKYLRGWHSDVPAADKNPDIKPSFIACDGKLVSLGKPSFSPRSSGPRAASRPSRQKKIPSSPNS
jgi:hypothetical protein